MKRCLLNILISLLSAFVMVGNEPYCTVRHYDESDGLSQRLVKQIVQDKDGVIWMATWNGLNRFDGYDFSKIKPHDDDDARSYSDRISDIRLSSTGDLWCRVDDRLLLFDTQTYSYADMNSELEEKFGKEVRINRILTSESGETVVRCNDGSYIVMPDNDPAGGARLVKDLPDLRYISPSNRKLGDAGGYRNDELVYSRRHADGSSWLISRDGNVMYSDPSGGDFRTVTRIDTRNNPLYYATTDRSGDVWLRSSLGAYRLSMGTHPYGRLLSSGGPSVVRCSARDIYGRIWISESDKRAVAVYDDLSKPPRYLGSDGRLHDSFVPFGVAAYIISPRTDGSIWIGTKPDGIFRLIPSDGEGQSSVYSVDRIRHEIGNDLSLSCDDVYDIASDRYGRMWIATLGGGLDCIERPLESKPVVKRLGGMDNFPQGALRARHITFVADSLLLLSTTGGLLVAPIPEPGELDSFSPRLHVSEPGRGNSLGNIAVMDAVTDSVGRIFVATESDGVNAVFATGTLNGEKADFVRFNTRAGMPSDIVHAVGVDPEDGDVIVTSNRLLFLLDPADSLAVAYRRSFWHDDLAFSDARPLYLSSGRWLLGLDDGAIVADLTAGLSDDGVVPLMFTSASIENRGDSLLAFGTDTLSLSPSERNLTLRFASLDFDNSGDILYAFRLDDGEWTNLGKSRSVTLLDMKPGDYSLEVRSTDSFGRWQNNGRRLALIVKPTFWETPIAICLYILTVFGVIFAIIYTVLYIRRIRRKQRETLDAYLKLLDSFPVGGEKKTVADASVETDRSDAQRMSPPARLSEADDAFMQRVMEFVNSHISDSDVTIDDMAAAVATSRSGLNRKMKSLLGVTPADFLKESRMNRAAALLGSTDLSVKDIALDCGFSDLNYFGKCFKSAYSLTPTAYRRELSSSDK